MNVTGVRGLVFCVPLCCSDLPKEQPLRNLEDIKAVIQPELNESVTPDFESIPLLLGVTNHRILKWRGTKATS